MSRFSAFLSKTTLLQRCLAAAGLFLLAVFLFVWLALPAIVRWRAVDLIADSLHRPAAIGRVRINPFALTVRIDDFRIMEPDSGAVFASFETLDVNLAIESLRHLAPVVQEARLAKPYLRLVRSAPRRYNIDDLIERFAAGPPSQSPPRFSLNNLRVEDGRIEFKDIPGKSAHTVDGLSLGVPFISSLPSQVGIFVEPLLRARVDGTPVELKGRAHPFAEPRDATLELELADLDLTRFVGYLPFEPRFALPSARLDAHLVASFRQPKGEAPALGVSGSAALRSVRVAQPDGTPVLAWKTLAASFERIDPFGRKLELAKLTLDGADADLRRGRDGRFNLERMLPAADARPAASDPNGWRIGLKEMAIRGSALRYRDEREGQPMHGSVRDLDLSVRGIAADTGARKASIAEVASDRAALALMLDKRTEPAPAAAPAATEATTGSGKAFAVQVGRLGIENWSVRLEDQGQPQPAIVDFAPLSLSAQELSGDLSRPVRLTLKTALKTGGEKDESKKSDKSWASLDGSLALAPLHADLAVDVIGLDVLPLQSLLGEHFNLRLTRGSLAARGRLKLDAAADGTLAGGYAGDAGLANLAAVDAVSGEEFLRWKSMSASGIDARLAPLGVKMDSVALSDFTARVAIDPSGRINLQDFFSKKRVGAAPQTAQPSPDAGKPVPIGIRRITFEGGRVRFSDNFIKPNYSARLVNLGGTVEGLSPDPASTASVDLRGEVNGAPLSIVGRVNPFRRDLLLDVKANVRGMELASLSPYATRYVGYGIEKGKLSFEVAYHVEQRRLTAENRLILNQLTLSDEATNPQAAKLPVKLALALLQDRDGVIDVNVPIQGSLNDPEFSLGGIVMKVIGNAIVKAVSQPFAALGALFGGGQHAQTSSMPFEAGLATIAPAGEAQLQTLAKALANRPALKLDINGWADPAADREGLKRAAIDRKVRTLKRNELQARGQAADYGAVTVSAQEYPALLARVYHEEKFPKPRNLIGLDKRLPVAEMEQLIIAHTDIGDDDLRALADRRARTVRDWLIKTGHVPGERLFLLAPDIGTAEGKTDGTSFSKVEFSLK